ncbi:SDR family NAD(P)-dependent oxidoreductase [Aquiflexum gelatinilyticum]|uniref:SDR family NAD(P)-dependent oxidoreductase n=1 Tax=Aquiflexum gelatinilyticum TaxID=2961943 RepID=A0A9X2P798_9BACT|nr:SDR family NAD(P)-dependent oxidoreductase [Aquiflexum gelatinilyticum]MCR9017378.1 SDR family NAD(P)-dependent oxidoreductase [Aquiflexum gelatinilyticum]
MKLAITGPTSGIGEVAFSKLTPYFNEVFLLARNESKANKLIQSLSSPDQKKVRFIYCDLADMDSVVSAAKSILDKTSTLDVLINNAGGIFQNKEVTKDGFEMGLSTNHLGHFLLTHHLMPVLLNSNGAKVINVSSEGHRAAKVDFDDLNYEKKKFSSFVSYANVKLFNILFTKSLADKYGEKGLNAYALHPGVVKTNFGKETSGVFSFFWKLASPFMITAEEGAKTTIFLAKTKIDSLKNGYYFKKSKPLKPSSEANSKKMRERLWKESEALLKSWL